MKESLEMHIRCIIYKYYTSQHLDICLFVKAVADKSQQTIKAFIPIPLEKRQSSI